jgi:hypothetical protein
MWICSVRVDYSMLLQNGLMLLSALSRVSQNWPSKVSDAARRLMQDVLTRRSRNPFLA